jgi:DNA polymerase-1
MKTLTIIDTFGFFFRSFYALPPLKSKDGFPTGLLTGFMNFINSIGRDYKTDYIVFALDSKGPSFRSEIDSEYKAHRPDVPEDLLKQLPVAIEWIELMGFEKIEKSGFEADDIIASLSKIAKKQGVKVRVVSHDKDLYQLIDDNTHLFDPIKRVEIDATTCSDKYGVTPVQFIDYQSLVGDSADNVPGVKGVGAKTAQKLLTQFNTLDGIYENIDFVKPAGTQKKLIDDKENAYKSKKLVTLHPEAIDECDIEFFKLPTQNPILKIEQKLIDLEMNYIVNKVKNEGLYIKTEEPNMEGLEFKAVLLDTDEKLFETISKIGEDEIIAFDTETDSLDSKSANIVGFSFAYEKDKAYYVPIAHNYLGVGNQISKESAKEAISKLFEHRVVGQNIKYDLNIIYNNFGFANIDVYADTMIMSWLVDSSVSAGLDNMAKRYFDYYMVKFSDVVPKKQTFASVTLDKAAIYAAEDAWMTLRLYHKLTTQLSDELLDVAKDVEFPFVNTLINMENEGIKIDCDFFQTLLSKTNDILHTLTKDIHTLANEEFNINSTKQLGVVLFERLNLRVVKKTKSGYSTDEKVLNELIDEHDIIPKLLEYREQYKLKSTYIEPLLNLAKAEDDSRVHTSFFQTGTTTGRLSSKNPNLQNIPVRTEIGKEIRKGFIAKEGYKLIGIDYSQIELRLLAHYSKDEALVSAFVNDKDIHTETAIKIFGEALADDKRSIAKSINFGLLYGMGSRKLSQTLGISTKEAKEYIDSYFASFPTVKDTIASIHEEVKQKGYVTTLLNRKRVFDFKNITPMMEATYLRESVNSIFQGSAADLIKMAMNKIDKSMDKSKAKMLLQIHDELIIEAKAEYVDEIAKEVQDIMENIYKLDVPLKTSLNIGDSWGELK